MRITATTNAVIVNFKVKGKTYGHDTGEAGGPATVHPFDSVTLAPGESFERDDAVVVNSKEVTPVASANVPAGEND